MVIDQVGPAGLLKDRQDEVGGFLQEKTWISAERRVRLLQQELVTLW
jgi:hypothetical protein